MPSREELTKAIAGLVRAGVSIEDANRLLDVVARDERNVLVLVALDGVPRPGDRIRATLVPGGQEQALRVIEAAPGEMVRIRHAVAGDRWHPSEQRWAIAGEPVRPSARDDVLVERGT